MAEAGAEEVAELVKRLEAGRFTWPSPADGVARPTSAQLATLPEGLAWHHLRPRPVRRPSMARRSAGEALQARGERVSPDDLAALSPLGWEHLNTGDYVWEDQTRLDPDGFRPLVVPA